MSLPSMTNEAALRYSLDSIVTLYEEAADPRTTNEKMLQQVDFVSNRTELVKALAPVTNTQSRCLDLMARIYDDMAKGNVRRYHAPFFLHFFKLMCMYEECRPFPLPPLYRGDVSQHVPPPPPATRSSPDTAETDTQEVTDTEEGET